MMIVPLIIKVSTNHFTFSALPWKPPSFLPATHPTSLKGKHVFLTFEFSRPAYPKLRWLKIVNLSTFDRLFFQSSWLALTVTSVTSPNTRCSLSAVVTTSWCTISTSFDLNLKHNCHQSNINLRQLRGGWWIVGWFLWPNWDLLYFHRAFNRPNILCVNKIFKSLWSCLLLERLNWTQLPASPAAAVDLSLDSISITFNIQYEHQASA